MSLLLLIISGIIAISAIVLRSILYKTRNFNPDVKYRYIIYWAITGNIVAYAGFLDMSFDLANPRGDYSSVLTVLSLLSAGVIAGNFTFTYQRSALDERFLPNMIAACFAILFLFLFGSLSFYIGKSVQVRNAEWMPWLGPSIMFIILFTNTLFDFWDYRQMDDDIPES
jgi:hypothetical protein